MFSSLEKTLMLGGIGGKRRRGRRRMGWLDGITDSMDVSLRNSGSWWWTGRPGVLRFMGSQRAGHDWATDLTERMAYIVSQYCLSYNWDFVPFETLHPVPPSSLAPASDNQKSGFFFCECRFLDSMYQWGHSVFVSFCMTDSLSVMP